MPSKIERILGDTTSYHKIIEAKVKGSVSKVLEMNCGTGKGATYSIFSKSDTKAGSNAVFFESDVMIETTTTAIQMYFEFQSSTTAYSALITCSGEGQPLQILGTDLGVNEGEWFTLRIEYRDVPDDFNYDGKSDVIARIYVNGTSVIENYTPGNQNSVVKSADVTRLRVRNTSGRAGIVYFDNTILGDCDMSYTPPAPADTDTLTFEPGVITDKTQATLGNSSSKLTILKSGVAGNLTNVLNFYTSKDSVDKLTIAPTLTTNGANAIMVETEILIDPTSETASLYLDPLTSGGNQAVRFTIEAEKGGKVTLYSKNSSGVNDPVIPSGVVIGNSGEWIKLKIEYMNPRLDYTGDGVDDILCRIYVDGILKATLYQLYKPGSFYDPSLMNRFLIFSASETDANVYFDNTKFWRTNLVYDEPPVKDPDIILGGNGSAGGKYDTDGWQ